MGDFVTSLAEKVKEQKKSVVFFLGLLDHLGASGTYLFKSEKSEKMARKQLKGKGENFTLF